MRVLRSILSVASVLVLAGASGCGKLKTADMSGAAGTTGGAGSQGGGGSTQVTGAAGSGNVLVTISGTAAPHPLNMALVTDTLDFSMLRVSIVDPSAVILNPNAAPLGSMLLDTTSTGNCDATNGCKWSISGVNISNPNLLGFVGTLEDTRTGDARVWVKTGTGMGTMADVASVRANPMPVTDRRAFVVSRKLEAALGAFLGPVLSTTFAPGALEARGFLIGHVVGKVSLGAMPVAGAKVAATGPFDVVYPAADFKSAGTTTSALGIFLMVPKMTQAVVASWDVVPPTGDTRTWETHLAGSNPNNAFIIIMQASE
jgi:hypothetical protein